MTTTVDISEAPRRPILTKSEQVFGSLVSFVFHPLFVPLYVTIFLLFVHPFVFAGYQPIAKFKLVATVTINLGVFPAVTVLLCRGLNFIDSIHLRTSRERIIPLAATMIFFFWGWFVLKDFANIPSSFHQFLLGSFITIIIAWLANIYFLISLHALGAGGLLCFISLLVFRTEGGSGLYITIATLIAGLVCSTRLLIGAHRPFDVYAGFMGGVAAQLLAVIFS